MSFPRWTPSLTRIALLFWTGPELKSSNALGNNKAKFRMGRRRWTTRLTVEECYALEIRQLVRAGVFDADPRSLCAVTWNDSADTPISSALFGFFRIALARSRCISIIRGLPRFPNQHGYSSRSCK